MQPLASSIISIVFLLFGAAAVFTMMSQFGSQQSSHPTLNKTIHRISGWIFILLFLGMFVIMLGKLERYWEEPPPRLTVHIILALALSLLLLAKVSIPRLFPRLGKNLFLLGFSIYLAAFTMVGITAGYYIVRTYKHLPYIYHAEIPEQMLDERLGKELFISKCSTCHMLKDVMKPRSRESWEKVLNEMFLLAEPRFTADEMGQILYYLTLTHVPIPFKGPQNASLIEKHCLPCHEATEIYEKHFSLSGWMEILKKMNQYDPKIVPEEKFAEIAAFLVQNQLSGTQ